MARQLKKNNTKWIKFEQEPEIEFLLKPFSVLYLTKIPSETNYTPETLWETFNHSVIDWKGINGEDGKPLKCTPENKRFVAEAWYDILTFVVLESSKLSTEKEPEIKNSSKSLPGAGPRSEQSHVEIV
jgi:hypothetical protein